MAVIIPVIFRSEDFLFETAPPHHLDELPEGHFKHTFGVVEQLVCSSDLRVIATGLPNLAIAQFFVSARLHKTEPLIKANMTRGLSDLYIVNPDYEYTLAFEGWLTDEGHIKRRAHSNNMPE